MDAVRTDKVRIFVSSPGDVQDERDQLDKVVRELNQTLSTLVPERGLILELWKWETDAYPGYGAGPQEVIGRQVSIVDFDIFIGILWRRFGTPTARAGSGTEEEFQTARESWRVQRRPREILFYFCQSPASPLGTEEEAQQQLRLASFREELSKEALVWAYPNHAAFADQVRPHLVQVISRILRPDETPSEDAERITRGIPAADLDATRRQVTQMAREYERIRETQVASHDRTRKMEVVASRMRSLALSTYPLLPEFANSDSPGKRLCAVTTLQALPRADFLQWLAERLPTEKPFMGYHAALALLNAARALDVEDLPKVRDAIAEARASKLDPDTDRDTTLRYAEEAVNERLLPRQTRPSAP